MSSGLTGCGQGAKNYLLSNGTSTTNFWEWHEDNMKEFSKEYGQLPSQVAPPTVTDQNPMMGNKQNRSTRVPQYSLEFSFGNIGRPFKEESDPKLLAAMEKLRKFAEERKKTNHMAMNFYSHLHGLYKPLTEQDLGGEWSDSTQFRTSCKNYVGKHLSAQGYDFTTENVTTFVERYMAEFPKLHLER